MAHYDLFVIGGGSGGVACALKARADYVVTRDKDLLSLGAHEGIRVVTPRQFLDLLGGSGAG